jgi:hypothetical protein
LDTCTPKKKKIKKGTSVFYPPSWFVLVYRFSQNSTAKPISRA